VTFNLVRGSHPDAPTAVVVAVVAIAVVAVYVAATWPVQRQRDTTAGLAEARAIST